MVGRLSKRFVLPLLVVWTCASHGTPLYSQDESRVEPSEPPWTAASGALDSPGPPEDLPAPVEVIPPAAVVAPDGLDTRRMPESVTSGDVPSEWPEGIDMNEVVVAEPIGFGTPLSIHRVNADSSWLVGTGDDFGMVSFKSYPILQAADDEGVVAGVGFHFLSGPVQTDLPPRLFDFQIGYHKRCWLTDSFGYDVAFSIGAFSDFEGSARKGVRFPSHGVAYLRCSDTVEVVVGVEFLDRDDISLLPVGLAIITVSTFGESKPVVRTL